MCEGKARPQNEDPLSDFPRRAMLLGCRTGGAKVALVSQFFVRCAACDLVSSGLPWQE